MKHSIIYLIIFIIFIGRCWGQDVFDSPKSNVIWKSRFDMSESVYQKKLNEFKNQGFRPIDIEITGGKQRRYSIIWRKGGAWKLRTKMSKKEMNQAAIVIYHAERTHKKLKRIKN